MLQVIENGAVDTEARRREINISRRERPMMRDFEDWCKREFWALPLKRFSRKHARARRA
jgi:hypothetical protein